VAGFATSTRRSSTRTADKTEAAARACSQARWRQDAEQHFGSRPVALTVIGPPHHPHVDAASLRACAAESTGDTDAASESPGAETLSCGGDLGFDTRTRAWDRGEPFRRLPMRAMVRMDVPADVTPMRHDGSAEAGA